MSRTRRYWFSNARPFHLATITSDDAPSPKANWPGCGIGEGGDALGQGGGTACVGGRDGDAQLERGLPGGGQGQGGEAVGPVDLGRPEIGVAEGAQAGVPLFVGVQGDRRRGS